MSGWGDVYTEPLSDLSSLVRPERRAGTNKNIGSGVIFQKTVGGEDQGLIADRIARLQSWGFQNMIEGARKYCEIFIDMML